MTADRLACAALTVIGALFVFMVWQIVQLVRLVRRHNRGE